MSDLEMAKELTDMGYDVGLDLVKENYNVTLVCEMAINEGYKFDEEKGKWI